MRSTATLCDAPGHNGIVPESRLLDEVTPTARRKSRRWSLRERQTIPQRSLAIAVAIFGFGLHRLGERRLGRRCFRLAELSAEHGVEEANISFFLPGDLGRLRENAAFGKSSV